MKKARFHTDALNNSPAVCSGFSLIEIIVSLGVFLIFFSTVTGGLGNVFKQYHFSVNKERAGALLDEGFEAARNMRDASFANLADGTYGLSTTGNQWNFSGASDTTDIFTRQLVVSTVTAHQKRIDATVSWSDQQSMSNSMTASTYLTDWRLITATIGDWANPNTQTGSLDLSGTNDGLKIQVSGNYAYLVRSGGTPDFAIINISNPSSPTLTGSLALTGNPLNIAVSGNYAYVVTDSDGAELQIINVSNPSAPSVVSNYNAPGNANVQGVFVVGTTVYIVRVNSANKEFDIVDASVPASPVSVGSLELGASANEVAVVGNYAYVAGANSTQELQIINISAPSAPVLVGSLNLPNVGNTIAAFGTTVVLGAQNNLHIIDVSNPASPSILGSYAAGGNINDISLGNTNRYAFLATANTTDELQVINIGSPASPALVGGFDALATSNGVAYDSVSDRAYMAGPTDTAELYIIKP